VIKHEPNYFGKRGFTSPQSLRHKTSIINVGQLEELADILAQERLKKEEKNRSRPQQTRIQQALRNGKHNQTTPRQDRISLRRRGQKNREGWRADPRKNMINSLSQKLITKNCNLFYEQGRKSAWPADSSGCFSLFQGLYPEVSPPQRR